MESTNAHSFSAPAWGVSLGLHAGVVWLAVLFTAQVKPVLMEEVFKWDVALVEPVSTDSASEPMAQRAPEPMEQVVPPVKSPRAAAPRPVEPAPDAVMHRVAPQQTVQMVHPEVQPPKPLERREETPPTPIAEPPAPVAKLHQEKPIEPVETKSESVTPTQEPDPVQSNEPVLAQQQPVATPSSDAVYTRPVEPAAPSAPAPAVSSPANPSPQEAPMQTAKAAPGGEVKPDHRWLAESLWRRVAELKRYPSSARLNGQEGKVILKAVIRADGQLAEVTVQKSSGHQILDAAAIEAVKLACPLHMKHAISKPEIVVSLPIVYSLAN
jgi:protein TonB